MHQIDWNGIRENIQREAWARELHARIQEETDTFISSYQDDPDRIAGWGHHYHCDDCNGMLTFDPCSPHAHVCGNCGKVNTGQKKDHAWTASYRSRAFSYMRNAGFLYRLCADDRYIKYMTDLLNFFSDHYHRFQSEAPAKRFQGKLTGINLSDAVGVISALSGMVMAKEQFTKEQTDRWETRLFLPLAELFDRFSNKIYNIPVWMKVAEGMIGLFFGNRMLVERAFSGRFGILDQLRRGVTRDGMWFEGSTHYHFYTLDPLLQLLWFSKMDGYHPPGMEEMESTILSMLRFPLMNLFTGGRFPNPCDGWPEPSLEKFVRELSYGAFLFGDDAVRKACGYAQSRTRPGMERLLLYPNCPEDQPTDFGSVNFEDSYCAILKNSVAEVYLKTGIKTICHAHPDVMTMELCFDGEVLSNDLGSTGYGSQIFAEWQRKTISHNTVTLDGQDQRYEPDGEGIWPEGIVEYFSPDRIRAKSKNVYECVDYTRDIRLDGNLIHDSFTVSALESHVMDWAFYCEGALTCPQDTLPSGPIGEKDGYQHLRDIRIFDGSLDWEISFETLHHVLILRMKGIPGTRVHLVNSYTKTFRDTRYGVIVRRWGEETTFDAIFECRKKKGEQ